MSDITRKLAILGCFLFTGFCFWKAGAGLIGGADAEILPSAQAAVHPSYAPPRVVTTPIQQMRPGMRIVGRNPLRLETEATIDPTPEGWRLISVRMRKEDGTYFEAELLRPLSWIHRHQAQPGAVIELNMPELHIVGAAEVLSISACPPIDPGDGPVVLSTFKNTANNALNIYVEGEAEPIGVTAGHPIWSEDRQAFIHSDQLQPGERLRSAVGKTVRITSIEIRAGPEPVYNLEVAGEHVYSVTDTGLLVHNTGECDPRGQNVDLDSLYSTTDVLSSSHLVSQADTISGVGLSAPRVVRNSKGELVYPNGAMLTNHAGKPVSIPANHTMSLRDPAMNAPPIIRKGSYASDGRYFTPEERAGFLAGNDGGTLVTPHHRNQIPIAYGGVMDELPRHRRHPEGNVHLGGVPRRHPNDGRAGRNRSIFKTIYGGEALHAQEVTDFFREKGARLIPSPDHPGMWIDPFGI